MISCVYCDGGRKSPSSDDRTKCGFCEDGVMHHPYWLIDINATSRDALLSKDGAG